MTFYAWHWVLVCNFQNYQPSSDSNIHRSVSVSQQPVMGASAIGRRGQFPYAYIRSKLAVLPEEQAGQISRRESMNGRGDGYPNGQTQRQEPAEVFAEISSRFRAANMSEEDLMSTVTRLRSLTMGIVILEGHNWNQLIDHYWYYITDLHLPS